MKRVALTICALLVCIISFAQAPESFSYQVVVRDGSSNNPLTNQNVSFKMSILKGSSSGESQYSELHSANTGALGIVNLVIGNGTGKVGSIYTIDWGAGSYFLKVEIDKTGGTTYLDMGTTQILSVPYALYAKTAETATETDPFFLAHPANVISNGDITNWNSIVWSEMTNVPAGFADGVDDNTVYLPGFGVNLTGETFSVNGSTIQYRVNGSCPTGSTIRAINADGSVICEVDNDTWTTNSQSSGGIVAAGGSNYNTLWKTDESGNPSWGILVASDIPDIDWSKITSGKPTTLTGYGITDGVNTTGNQIIGGTKTFSNTISGNIAGNAGTVTDGVYTTGNQTINGNKIFTGTITVPTPVNDQDAATKAYVDENGPTTYSVGDFAQGGIVFWVDETGQHGLVCAKTDQSTLMRWYAGTNGDTRAYGDHIFAGKMNTDVIVGSSIGIIGDDQLPYASEICKDLTLDGYSDWYLPSKEELNLMNENKATIDATAIANGGIGFADYDYWSSTEYDNEMAWYQDFATNTQFSFYKGYTKSVRAVRSF